MLAAGKGNFELIKYLIENNAQINAMDNQNFSHINASCKEKKIYVSAIESGNESKNYGSRRQKFNL
ncbi:MAG: ankyrin repeat domain-containing protein [Desulfobacterales bacterium]|nr:ankyrin repeat domain-containing protein [Desulfobacterales bacterium]